MKKIIRETSVPADVTEEMKKTVMPEPSVAKRRIETPSARPVPPTIPVLQLLEHMLQVGITNPAESRAEDPRLMIPKIAHLVHLDHPNAMRRQPIAALAVMVLLQLLEPERNVLLNVTKKQPIVAIAVVHQFQVLNQKLMIANDLLDPVKVMKRRLIAATEVVLHRHRVFDPRSLHRDHPRK